MTDKKEMTEYGPVRILGDCLESCIHRSFTVEADDYLGMGYISREERIALSGAIGEALNTFHRLMPAGVASRLLSESHYYGDQPVLASRLSKLAENFSKSLQHTIEALILKSKPVVEASSKPSAFTLVKEADGEAFVILTYSNKWEDREDDILSENSHLKYAEFVNDKGFRPQITPFHQPTMPKRFWLKVYEQFRDDIPMLNAIVKSVYRGSGFAIAEADRVLYMNGFTMMVGKVYPDMMDVAEKLAAMPDIGSSHSFVTTDFTPREKSGTIIEAYWTFEGSPLPRDRAANPLTAISLEGKSMEQVAKLSKSDEQFMVSLLGQQRFDTLKAGTGDLAEKLEKLLGFKVFLDATADEKAAPVPDDEEESEDDAAYSDEKPKKGKKPVKKELEAETPAVEPVAETEPAKESIAAVAPDVSTIVPEVLKALNVEGLQKVIGDLVEANKSLTAEVEALKASIKPLEEIKKSDDQRIADQLTPVNWGFNFQKSQADETVTEKTTEEVEKLAPKVPAKASDGPFDPMSTLWSQFGQ